MLYALSYIHLFILRHTVHINHVFPWTKQFLCIIYIWKKSISIFLFSQNTIITAMRASKPQQTGVQSTVKPHKWTYASAFLYSLTLITTIGKCVFIRTIFFLFIEWMMGWVLYRNFPGISNQKKSRKKHQQIIMVISLKLLLETKPLETSYTFFFFFFWLSYVNNSMISC